jgi:hypothetical protein
LGTPSGKSSRRDGWAWLAVSVCIACLGCSVIKATQQPDKRDLNVLGRGIPRTQVIAELGRPLWSEERGPAVTDVFVFKQGYSKPAKATRALVHGAADVATWGLWEVLGVPLETMADGTEVQAEVRYDENRLVESVRIFRGKEVVFQRHLFTGKPVYPGVVCSQPVPACSPATCSPVASPTCSPAVAGPPVTAGPLQR